MPEGECDMSEFWLSSLCYAAISPAGSNSLSISSFSCCIKESQLGSKSDWKFRKPSSNDFPNCAARVLFSIIISITPVFF